MVLSVSCSFCLVNLFSLASTLSTKQCSQKDLAGYALEELPPAVSFVC